MAGGRPTKYKDEYVEQARKLCALGATNEDLADFFNVATSTIEKWMAEIDEFSGAIKESKELADAKVIRSLFERATGYTYISEEKTVDKDGEKLTTKHAKHYPPDVTAMIFWLKNRQSDDWRDKKEIEHIKRTADDYTDEELARIAAGGSTEAIRPSYSSKQTH